MKRIIAILICVLALSFSVFAIACTDDNKNNNGEHPDVGTAWPGEDWD